MQAASQLYIVPQIYLQADSFCFTSLQSRLICILYNSCAIFGGDWFRHFCED